ncbi:MAG: S46 family peptidase [Pirellulaceae bacterium]
MWLFNQLPVDQLQQRYQFQANEDWIQHLMLSSVRFNSGGSASFVSSDGLVLTNHHVASDTLQKLSTPDANYMVNGFLAKTWQDELKTPDLELNQLVSIQDVTDRVNQAVDSNLSTADAAKARRAAMAQIEAESLEQTGLRSDVITLFGGAKYHLYRYKKYTDVRLVWAPETKAAFFGGDADNFEYPRYCLDVALFRVYEDGKPAKIDHFLRYANEGVADGDLVFVSGNPGRTQRIFTVSALKYLRDTRLPHVLDSLRRREILLQQYGFEGPEQKRRARDELFGIQNARKAYTGMLQGLQNPAFLNAKQQQEQDLLTQVATLPNAATLRQAWDEVADIQQRNTELLKQNASFARSSRLYEIAETLVLMLQEDQKPSDERLREFRDSARESLEQDLYSSAPIYPDLETVKLADAIAQLLEERGADSEFAQKVLDGKSPRDRAADLINGTRLADIPVRQEIAGQDAGELANSNDPMVQLALSLNEEYRRLREIREELSERERQAYARITEAGVAIQGDTNYPDATFTLRLAFGAVRGYQEDGVEIPFQTSMGGAFEHEAAHDAEGDWQLPESWHTHKDKIQLATPLNFVCTADIIGGNSGSPVVNRQGELVGVIFDGNIQSLTSDFFYSDEQGRAVCVHAAALVEALTNIYDAKDLANRIGR